MQKRATTYNFSGQAAIKMRGTLIQSQLNSQKRILFSEELLSTNHNWKQKHYVISIS